MFFSLSKMISVAVLVSVATAIPTGENVEGNGGSTTTTPGNSCSTGELQCCDSLETGSTGVLGGLIGTGCVPLVGGACQAQAVCCTNNAQASIVSFGCVPIQL
ncbi:hydrophobin 1 [Lentinula raphanica]|uniref:Hydrophobin n=1 Tax=Lentinula raphanica TaxID=153919 RepID=A0AA38UIE2_9AGAR|nr:hydrophobin 1 [Lentinula raphanica]KAJ3828740.1 hydrophobin 1 [Lentinula raphanica]KAJ3842534.1 hydrophobin 1 [Lentinula raphanica]KAJ3974228.1 hydrophobin 1 [Lentinula raphanica]